MRAGSNKAYERIKGYYDVSVNSINKSTVFSGSINLNIFNRKPMMVLMILFFIINSYCVTYSQIGLETKIQQNEISPNIYFNFDIHPLYSFQYNLGVTIIPNDNYNENKTSGSTYGAYSLGAILGLAMLTQSGGSEGCALPNFLPESSQFRPILKTFGIICAIPIILSNGQHYLNLYGFDTLSSNKIGFSLFMGSQTDYFDKRDISWLRFAVRGGLEIFVHFNEPQLNKHYHGFGISFQVGITRHWDYLRHSQVSSPNFGFIGTKFYFPI